MTPEQAIETINQIILTPKNLHALNGEETLTVLRCVTILREALKQLKSEE